MFKNKRVQGVVFDWAGTTIDYGCRAPLQVFLDIFQKKGIPITKEEASKPMGMLKIEHIRELFKMERIKNSYFSKFKHYPNENTVDEFYALFEPLLFKILKDYSKPIPHVLDTINYLRSKGIKIGSTSGYTREMMEIILPHAKANGYQPDFLIASSEVKQGRPHPWMMFRNAEYFQISPMESWVKVGDTKADILEGISSGSWSVGIIEGSSTLGMTEDEFQDFISKSSEQERINKYKEVTDLYMESGADYVINNMGSLKNVIQDIDKKLLNGKKPGNFSYITPQPYLLFTPGPITTSENVKKVMMTDWGSRELDYLELVRNVRHELVNLSTMKNRENYTTVIIQGSGTFGVESCIGSILHSKDKGKHKLLVLVNGQYGERICDMARILNLNYSKLEFDETEVPDVQKIDEELKKDKDITHVAFIHSETTTGILNPLSEINKIIKKHNKISIVDAMSSFGAVPIDMNEMQIDFLISSSNKNIQGVPGFAYVICNKKELQKIKDESILSKSLSLALYEQWQVLEKSNSFRFTSPVHTIRAFEVAMKELELEGGVEARFKRYTKMQKRLSEGMKELFFKPLDLKGNQGPIITTFHSPKSKDYNFNKFYENLKNRKCVIYPGKLTKFDSFRIGTMGDINIEHVDLLLNEVKNSMFWDNKL
jgi:2-aminoethylphosphonate--pyruvate transaminase/phosphonoacetaldehyde hydrolase